MYIHLTVEYYVHLYVIQSYRNFEESSLINIVENYNHYLAGIGSHGSILHYTKSRSENVRSECRWSEFTVNKELSSIS